MSKESEEKCFEKYEKKCYEFTDCIDEMCDKCRALFEEVLDDE